LKNTFLIGLGLVLLLSCGGDEETTEGLLESDTTQTQALNNTGEATIISPVVDEEITVLEKNGIKLTEIKSESNIAKLTLNTKSFIEGKNHLNFQVEGVDNYKIAYLSNNYYLSRFSSDVFEMEFLIGNNVFLAFLLDKNNIAIKSNEGSVLKNAIIGNIDNMFDMDQPHLFYYMPQENGKDAILDFYLVNTSISQQGNKVKVVINESEFLIDKWAAYQISGLSGSENRVRIQLIDKNGNLIDGPFNDSGERSFQNGDQPS
jgi:hypothetical protein